MLISAFFFSFSLASPVGVENEEFLFQPEAEQSLTPVSVGGVFGMRTMSAQASYWVDERWTLDGRVGILGAGDSGGLAVMAGGTHRWPLLNVRPISVALTGSLAAGAISGVPLVPAPGDDVRRGLLAETTGGISVILGPYIEIAPEAGFAASPIGNAPLARLRVSFSRFFNP